MVNWITVAQMSNANVFLFGVLIFACFAGLIAVFYLGWWITKSQNCPSPYTGMPLRYVSEIPYSSKEKIVRFMNELKSYDNRIFDLQKASYCRDTGRIFPNSIGWFGNIEVDWRFLNKRFPGSYVSWGSLSADQQQMIRELHVTLDGFQTEESSPNPLPRTIEQEFAYSVPGPLYVDLETKILLGWKEVPGSEFEVLIVQRPVKPHVFNIPKELQE